MKKLVKAGLGSLVLVPFVAALTVQASEYDGVTSVPTGALEAAAQKQGAEEKLRQKMLIELYKERKVSKGKKIITPVAKTEADSESKLEDVSANSKAKRNWRPSARSYIQKDTTAATTKTKKVVNSAPAVASIAVKASAASKKTSVGTGVSQVKLQQVESILNQAKAGKITEAQFNSSLQSIVK